MYGRRIQMLNVESVVKSFDEKKVLHDVSFTAEKGEIIGLVGENGAGKSTLLHILATLQKPSNGKITLDGQSYQHETKEIRKKIGLVPQDIAIWEEFTVEENMKFFEKLSWKDKSVTQMKQLCVDMELDKWKEPVHILSGGMKRKLNLAISLIHDPEVLFLDEPTVGIDLKSRSEIGAYLQNLADTQDTLIIYTSHDMDEITTLCDRVLCLGEDPFYQDLLTKSGQEMIVF